MSENSPIEWCRHSFCAWWGCVRVSDGCRFCYADTLNNRYKRAEWGVGGKRTIASDAYWRKPLKWDREAAAAGERHRVFSSSMSDVFEDHPAVVDARARLFDLIRCTPNLDWLLLTKRPENITSMLPADWGDGWPNVVLLTSVEDDRVRHRIRALQGVPSLRRGLSCEPLIGPLDLTGYLDGISWVIVGGESGAQARPWHWDWPRHVRDACVAAGVPFFYKQHGEWVAAGVLGRHAPLTMDKKTRVVFPNGDAIASQDELHALSREQFEARFAAGDGSWCERIGKKKAGRVLDGRTWDQFPDLQVSA
jgi:protein gp37